MQVTEFDLTFTHYGKKIIASCQKFKVVEYPQIRVAFSEAGREYVFIYYDVNEKNKRFFWYPLEGKKEQIARSIVRALAANPKATA